MKKAKKKAFVPFKSKTKLIGNYDPPILREEQVAQERRIQDARHRNRTQVKVWVNPVYDKKHPSRVKTPGHYKTVQCCP
jgi:hypothetical protein